MSKVKIRLLVLGVASYVCFLFMIPVWYVRETNRQMEVEYISGYESGVAGCTVKSCPHWNGTGLAHAWKSGWSVGAMERKSSVK